jgi:hypothetical protein
MNKYKHKTIFVWIVFFALMFFFWLNVVYAQPPREVPKLPRVKPPRLADLSFSLFIDTPGALPDLYPDNPGMGPSTFSARGDVVNWGEIDVPAGCEVKIFLSRDATISSDDKLLETITITEPIPRRVGSRLGAVSFRGREHSVVGIPPGGYLLCGRVDPANRIAESNERNNDGSSSNSIRIYPARNAEQLWQKRYR